MRHLCTEIKRLDKRFYDWAWRHSIRLLIYPIAGLALSYMLAWIFGW